jgi:hypothetical protein
LQIHQNYKVGAANHLARHSPGCPIREVDSQ